MIQLEGVCKQFGAVEALQPLNLEVRQGEWLGLFGHNGSGKTTLLRILLGLSRPSGGQVLLDGAVPNAKVWKAFRNQCGFMPERISFYEHLTGEETLRYFARLRGVDAEAATGVLERVGLLEAARRQIGTYSKGMCQRLNLGQALLGDPEVLIMDEPIEGLDPRGVRDFFELLQQGRLHTVVLTSHRLSEVCPRVDRVCILDGGAVRALGSVEELLRDLKRPVQVHIYPVPSTNGTVESVLRGLQSRSLEKKDGKWVVEVSQEDKVAFLTGLGACNGSIQRIYVEEPSLEEVYFEAD